MSDVNDGQWLGRVKMRTDKENKIIDELKIMRKSTDNALSEIRNQMDSNMDSIDTRLDNFERVLKSSIDRRF